MSLTYVVENASLPGVLVASVGLSVACLLLYIGGTVIYNIFFHPSHKFPGPVAFGATDIPYIYHIVRGTSVARIHELHDAYGPVIRTGPNRLSFSDPAAFKDLYGHRQGKPNMEKDPELYTKPPNGVPNIIVADDANHSRQRRYLAHAFSAKALEAQQYLIMGYIDMFIEGLKKRSGEKVDMVAWYNFTTFDIIGSLAFGQDFSCLDRAAYHPWVQNVFGSVKALSMIHAAKCYPIVENLLQKCIPKSISAKRATHFKFATERTEARMVADTDRKDFMSYIIKHNDEKGMSRGEITVNAATLVLAGSETTATLLSGTTYFLLKNSSALRKLTEEVRSGFKTEEEINFESVSKLPYLNACLEEAFRMYPPVPIGLSRLIPEGGDFVAGHFIPGGTKTSVSHWSTYQSSRNFKDPQSYVPERWLDDPQFASDNKEGLQPFSLGPRNCIGKNLAYVEMRLILARFLWNFDIELCDDSQEWARQKVFSLWEKGSLNVRVVKREGL